MSLSNLLFPLGKDPKSPHDMILDLKLNLNGLLKKDKNWNKCWREVSKTLKRIKDMLYGTFDSEHETESIRRQIIEELYKTNLLSIWIENHTFPFECRKNIVYIFGYAIGQQIGTRLPSVEYMRSKPGINYYLIKGYEDNELALICGQIIRECIDFETLAELFLSLKSKNDENRKLYCDLFNYIENQSLPVSLDAFSTLSHLLTKHKSLVKILLQNDYEIFGKKFNQMLNSENIFIKRKSIELLTELLYDRNLQIFMKRYISSTENLHLISSLMKNNCRFISYEALKLLKLFVLNPESPQQIKESLLKARETLITQITKLGTDRPGIERFVDEKGDLIKKLTQFV